MGRGDDAGDEAPAAETLSEGLAESAPLFIISGLMFAAGYLFWRDGSVVGPHSFPLWDLLISLGCVAAAGGILSWFFATSAPSAARGRSTSRDSGADGRMEFGRPRPDVARAAPPPTPTGGIATAVSTYGTPLRPIWSEDDLPMPAPRVVARARTDSTGAASAGATESDHVNLMLAELDDIERDVAPRRRPGEPTASS